MNPDFKKSFLTFYLQSLNERTRQEKKGSKWGLDWVVYNLGLSLFGKPIRLPFTRTAVGEYAKPKNEAEFGIDVSFLSEDENELTIFVLKDESLTNRSWTDNDFCRDLQMAMQPDLDVQGLENVKKVTVILAYNKDEEQNGVEAFDRLVKNAQPTLKNNVSLNFKRWNLSDLVDQILNNLLSPTLVPQKFFGQLTYLCAQAADFAHGSDAWDNQLLPAWKHFLEDILGEGTGVRGVTLVPVALIIISHHAQDNPTIPTGNIDLAEWAAIFLWKKFGSTEDKDVRNEIFRFWTKYYLIELEGFYSGQMPFLATPQSVDQVGGAGYVGSVAASYIGYWHLGRLGILSLAFAELLPDSDKAGTESAKLLDQISVWIEQLVGANYCLYRPVLDIHHIEIYLLTMAWVRTGRIFHLVRFLENLVTRLRLRRIRKSDLPFLDGFNSLENVYEQIISKSGDEVVETSSSFFVLMLLELVCVFEPAKRDEFIMNIHRYLVLGDSPSIEPLNLISWIAPADWDVKVLSGYVSDGDAVSLEPLSESVEASADDLLKALDSVVTKLHTASKLEFKNPYPLAALVLASLKYQSPLPPEIWRSFTMRGSL